MKARSNAILAAAAACILAGCSQNGTLSSPFTTGSIDPQKQAADTQAAKATEATCLTLSSQIEALNTEGVPEKVAKAAAKKYKLKATDIQKVDELNKANVEFQSKCSSYPPRVASPAPADMTPKTPGAPKQAAAAPALPQQKPAKTAAASTSTPTAPVTAMMPASSDPVVTTTSPH
jgi:hypothetical protein